MALIICFVCGTLGATSAARSAPDIRTLLTQLNHLSTTDRAAREILQAAGEDSSARQYVVQQLPEMINKPEVNEIWLNAVRLAGKLKATEPTHPSEKHYHADPSVDL